MKRFDYKEWEDDDGALQGWLSESEHGEYVLHEDVEPIIADRDIKAANLQLLVDKVLDFDAREQGDIDAIAFMDSVEKDWTEIVELARGLKQ